MNHKYEIESNELRPKYNWFELQQKNKPQAYAVAGGIWVMFTSGFHIGWGIFNPKMKDEQYTLNETNLFIHFTIASFYYGSILGSFFGGYWLKILNKRQIYLLSTIIIGAANILIIILPENGTAILLCRLITGFIYGVLYITIIIHAGEIAVKEFRGMLLTIVYYVIFVSILCESIIDTSLKDVPKNSLNIILIGSISAGSSLIGLIMVFIYFIESPIYLIKSDKHDDAFSVMMKLRNETNITWDIQNNHTEMVLMIQEDLKLNTSVVKEENLRPLILVGLSTLIYTLSFNYPLNMIRLNSISKSQSKLEISIGVLVIKLTVGLVCYFLTDKIGRKKLQLLSGGISGIILLLYGILCASIPELDLQISVIFFIVYEITVALGIASIVAILQSEAFPLTKKPSSIITINIIDNIINIILIAVFFGMEMTNSISAIFVVSVGGIMLFISGYLYHVLPETRTMTLRQARAEFRKKGDVLFYGNSQPMSLVYS